MKLKSMTTLGLLAALCAGSPPAAREARAEGSRESQVYDRLDQAHGKKDDWASRRNAFLSDYANGKGKEGAAQFFEWATGAGAAHRDQRHQKVDKRVGGIADNTRRRAERHRSNNETIKGLFDPLIRQAKEAGDSETLRALKESKAQILRERNKRYREAEKNLGSRRRSGRRDAGDRAIEQAASSLSSFAQRFGYSGAAIEKKGGRKLERRGKRRGR